MLHETSLLYDIITKYDDIIVNKLFLNKLDCTKEFDVLFKLMSAFTFILGHVCSIICDSQNILRGYFM